MRLAYLAAAAIPSRTANSINIVKMCEALGELGHEVTLFAPHRNRGDVFEFYGLNRSFTVRYAWYPDRRYVGHLYAFTIANAARRMKADLCLGRYAPACFFAARFGLPVVFDIHGPPAESGILMHRMFRSLIAAPSFRAAIATTHALAEHCKERYEPLRGRLIVASNGADLPVEGQPRADLARPGKLNVGYAGHLYRGKGMEIIASLVPSCPFAHFHVVGGRPEDVAYWRAMLAGRPNVTFYGHLGHAEVASYLRAFDVLVLPNQRIVHGNVARDIGRWTSPIKLFEYMAAAKAIVASDLPVLREVAVHERNALLCSPDQPDEWRAALCRLLSEPGLRDRLGVQAKADFLADYTWRRRAERALEVAHVN